MKHLRKIPHKRNIINAIVLIFGVFIIFKKVYDHIDFTSRVSGRGSEPYVQADFQNSVLVISAVTITMCLFLYYNRKTKTPEGAHSI